MILVIDNYDSFTYNLFHYLGELGAEVRVVRNDEISAAEALDLKPQGIVLSLEQTENYESQRGGEGTRDNWHDRSAGIEGATDKAVGKWMPEELMKLAERKSPNRVK